MKAKCARMNVRRAGLGDLEALLPLVRQYRRFYQQQTDAEAERSFIEARLRDGTGVVYVAEEERALLGFVQLFQTFNTVRLAPALILEDLFVDADMRGRGVARTLISVAEDYARAIGAAVMFLETAIDNRPAQSVYEKAGWTREAQFFKYNAPL